MINFNDRILTGPLIIPVNVWCHVGHFWGHFGSRGRGLDGQNGRLGRRWSVLCLDKEFANKFRSGYVWTRSSWRSGIFFQNVSLQIWPVANSKIVINLFQILNLFTTSSKSMLLWPRHNFWLCYHKSQLQSQLASTFPRWIVLHFHHWIDYLLCWKKRQKNLKNEVQRS